MSAARTLAIVVATSVVSGGIGYLIAPRPPAPTVRDTAETGEPEQGDVGDELASEPAALEACEARLEEAELALATRPVAAQAPAIDPAQLPEETRAAIATPEVSRAIDAEVERRIAEHFERERERRRAEWAARRAELRERMHAIGIDEATIEQVTPTMCAIRDVFRQAWREGRAGGAGGAGDAGVRGGRRAVMEATRPMRDEVAATLGDERMARLEDEGGLRALGGAIACEGDEDPPGARR